jgi:chaperone BCS1
MTSTIAQYGTTLLTGLATEYIPFGSVTTKMTMAMLGAELLKSASVLKNNKYINKLFEKKRIVIKSDENPIYEKLEEYLINKFYNDINKYTMVPKNGEMTTALTSDTFTSPIIDTFKEHKINIVIEKASGNDFSIVLDSKTADINLIKEYIETNVNMIERSKSKLLKVYRAANHSTDKKQSNIRWEKVYTKTNKNFNNTIVSDKVNGEFFKDVTNFMDNEKWYTEKGLPYKRGYCLYGPPGTGKTSLIKALANEYSLDIFCIDLESVKDNDDLNKLISEINYYAKNNKYILCFEDIDRADMFKKQNAHHYYYLTSEKTKKISIGTFINILDGIVESHGRVLILTANDISELKSNCALTRPGRIDRFVEVGFCDSAQFKRLYNLFFPNVTIDETKIKPQTSVTPADFIQMVQINCENPEKILEYLYGNIELSAKPNIPLTAEEIAENKKKELAAKRKTGLNKDKDRLKALKKRLTREKRWAKSSTRKMDRLSGMVKRAETKIELKMTKEQAKKFAAKLKERKKRAKKANK